jgi:hypothetical protein
MVGSFVAEAKADGAVARAVSEPGCEERWFRISGSWR